MVEKVNVFLPEQIFKDRAVVQLDECVCKKGTPEEYRRTKLYKTYQTFFRNNPELVMKALSVKDALCHARFTAARDSIG